MTNKPVPAGASETDAPEYHLPPDHWPLPELSTVEDHPHPPANRYVATRDSEEFQQLRSRFRGFAFPTVIAVLVWYLVFVLCSTYAEDFMSTPALGNLNVGMLIGLAQFPTTWFATWAYVRRMERKLDPIAKKIREDLETETKEA